MTLISSLFREYRERGGEEAGTFDYGYLISQGPPVGHFANVAFGALWAVICALDLGPTSLLVF